MFSYIFTAIFFCCICKIFHFLFLMSYKDIGVSLVNLYSAILATFLSGSWSFSLDFLSLSPIENFSLSLLHYCTSCNVKTCWIYNKHYLEKLATQQLNSLVRNFLPCESGKACHYMSKKIWILVCQRVLQECT